MTDETALRRDMDRAARAQRLMEDELLAEAFDSLDASFMTLWRGTATPETSERERLWMAISVLSGIRGHFQRVLTDGKVAAAELAEIERQRTRTQPRVE